VYGSGPAEVQALTGVKLSVRTDEMIAIMGRSGSGKSTLLTIAGSLEQPISGTVLIEGRPLSGLSRSEQARMRRRHVGYVFQDFNLLPGLTAAENIALPLELDGTKPKVAAAAARRALVFLRVVGDLIRIPLTPGQQSSQPVRRGMVGQ
jgi:putative ABC transport system ATP-binding protein